MINNKVFNSLLSFRTFRIWGLRSFISITRLLPVIQMNWNTSTSQATSSFKEFSPLCLGTPTSFMFFFLILLCWNIWLLDTEFWVKSRKLSKHFEFLNATSELIAFSCQWSINSVSHRTRRIYNFFIDLFLKIIKIGVSSARLNQVVRRKTRKLLILFLDFKIFTDISHLLPLLFRQ